MNRRTVLAGAGLVTSVSFAGCLDAVPFSRATDATDGRDEQEIPDSPSEYPVNSGDLEEFDPERTIEEISVGSRDGVDDAYRPHDVAIWNADADIEIELRIIDYGTEAVVHRDSYDLPSDAALSVELLEPSEYLVEVTVPSVDRSHTVRVPCRFFDCNDSTTRIGIVEESLRSSVISTLIGCPDFEC